MLRQSIDEILADIFKALGHPTRTKIVSILGEEGEKCVCELVDRLGVDQSTVSKHLAVLKQAGIVTSQKTGLNVIYSLNMVCAYQFIKCIESLEQGTGAAASCGLRCQPSNTDAPED